MNLVSLFVWAFYAYLAIGAMFAAWFVASGVNKVDEGVRHAGWGLRLLLFPGSVLLWPVLLKKYLKVKSAAH